MGKGNSLLRFESGVRSRKEQQHLGSGCITERRWLYSKLTFLQAMIIRMKAGVHSYYPTLRTLSSHTSSQIYMWVISNRFECDLISLETCHNSSSAFICVRENESGAKPGQIPCFPSALAAEVLAVTAHANTQQLCLCNVTNYKITQNRSA